MPAARAKFFLDGVAVGQGSFEALQLVAHLDLNYGLDENFARNAIVAWVSRAFQDGVTVVGYFGKPSES